MTTGNLAGRDAELEAFLGRRSVISTDYGTLEPIEPPASLDEKIIEQATTAAKESVPRTVPQSPTRQPVAARPADGVSPESSPSPVERRKRPRTPTPDTDDDDDQDEAPLQRRPRWLVPAAVAVVLLVAVGVVLMVLPGSPSSSDTSFVGSMFAKRARERSEAEKAAAAAAAGQDAEVITLDPAPLPPLPVVQPEGPQVQDLDAAIAVIRKELVLANQKAAMADEAAPRDGNSAPPQGSVADTVKDAARLAAPDVVQPRELRLTKILELYDEGNPDLAADSLEIFLRDFADDPVSKRILKVKP